MTEPRTLGTDDVLRYVFSQGPGRDFVAPLGPRQRPVTTSFGTLPERVATDRMCRLVWGTADLLEETVYPTACAADWLSDRDRLQHALVMAFGLQRREPSNLFNDHRSCASVRSRFPVHAFLHTDDKAWFVDVYRHGLLPVGEAGNGWPEGEAQNVALAGRYTHLPSLYGRLRGPLAELEMGISLRSLWVALDILGVEADLQLPGPSTGQLMARLGLDPRSEWTAPLTVAVHRPGGSPQPGRDNPAGPSKVAIRDDPADDDPTLAEVVAVNRTTLDMATLHSAESRHGTARAVPLGLSSGERSWSEVVWNRNSGRMPRHLAGVSGRRRPLPPTAVHDALAWLAVPPPTPLLDEIARRITVSVCLQDAPGFATGWYRVDGPAHLELVSADPALPARLEGCYGHGLGPEVGCAVRHAGMIWLLSCDVPALLAATGPAGWTLAQYVVGWMAHGLCLAAAAHGLYARPNRAFDEILLHPVVAMAPGEIVLLSVVSGAGRFVEPYLDLRT